MDVLTIKLADIFLANAKLQAILSRLSATSRPEDKKTILQLSASINHKLHATMLPVDLSTEQCVDNAFDVAIEVFQGVLSDSFLQPQLSQEDISSISVCLQQLEESKSKKTMSEEDIELLKRLQDS